MYICAAKPSTAYVDTSEVLKKLFHEERERNDETLISEIVP